MGLDNNDDIARMFGAKVEEKKPLPKKYGDKNTKIIEVSEMKESDMKLSASDMEGAGKNLANVPPFLILGIVCIVAAGFTPYKWLFYLGFLFIIMMVFDKVLTPEKKQMMKDKIKGLFKKK